MLHIAIDLGKRKSQVCVRAESGEILKEEKIATKFLGEYLRDREPSRVVMETCSEAFAVARMVSEVGHTPVVVPSTLAPALGVGARGIKTDKRDARVLSEASVRMPLEGVHIPSAYARVLKQECGGREILVKTRTQLVNHVKGWLRGQLLEVKSGCPETLADRLRASGYKIPEHIEAVLRVLEATNQEVKAAKQRIDALAQADKVCQRLMTVPGVGPITAVRFRGAVDEVGRFPNASAVESYFGLTPGENSSSERVAKTGITKAGASQVRMLLMQCAHVAMSRCQSEPMTQWALELARKKNRKIAVVALARKMCGILYALWKHDDNYQPSRGAQPLPPLSTAEVATSIWRRRKANLN